MEEMFKMRAEDHNEMYIAYHRGKL